MLNFPTNVAVTFYLFEVTGVWYTADIEKGCVVTLT